MSDQLCISHRPFSKDRLHNDRLRKSENLRGVAADSRKGLGFDLSGNAVCAQHFRFLIGTVVAGQS